ncbi:MAG: selenide, water dikinase SelD, partial [Actinomycetota bacterium]|nr:selenide, water dikinase SelD [Actinomycetota bacterium]
MKTTSHDPAVLVGLDVPDDAAVYRMTSRLALVQTVDFFTPVVDDAFAWGRISAANALSDIYAMGGRPITCLNLVAWPRTLGFALLGRVLEGGGDACAEAGVAVVGGHSVDDPEPKFGMAVTGLVDPRAVVRTKGAPAGSNLVLTKPLGSGIISTGIKEGRAGKHAAGEATRIMSQLNRAAAEAMIEVGVLAATDVTGFGLVGHLLEMLGPLVSAQLSSQAIPIMEEAAELAGQGMVPGGSLRNHEAMRDEVHFDVLDDDRRMVLF